MEPWHRFVVALILLMLSSLMAWKVRSSLKSGVFVYRSPASRADQPKWFWVNVAFSAIFVVYTLWFALWLIWPHQLPAPYLPCNPRFPSTCD